MIIRFNLYQDELLYSALARYEKVSANTSIKDTQFDVFLSKTKSASVELPSSIDLFMDQLPMGTKMTSEFIILEYTNLRYYVAFKLDALRVRAMMKDNNGSGIYAKSGIMASSVKSKQFFWYCPKCFSESFAENGEVYWNRHHQLPGVLGCHKHNVLLRKSKIPIKGFNKHEFHAAEWPLNANALDYAFSNVDMEILLKVSQYSFDLLAVELPHRDSEWFKNQYIVRLQEMRLATVNGRVDRKRLKSEFVDYFRGNLLAILQLEGDINKWITKLISKKSTSVHPLMHIVFSIFLRVNLNDLFHEKMFYNPFGEPLWPCMNPICLEFEKLVIDEFRVRHNHDTKKPQGYFKCPVCGYEYFRFGPDLTFEDRFGNTKVVDYGHLWRNKLADYLAANKSLREIAKLLFVDTGTVIKYSKRLKENNQSIEQDSVHSDREKRRNEWITVMDENSDLSKTQLRKLKQGLYIWLYRHDSNWLNLNSPKPIQGSNINKRVDWEQRDVEILEALKGAYQEIMSFKDRLLRVTKTGLSKIADHEALISKHLEKMPRCEMYIESVVEIHSDFRRRRVEKAIEELEAEYMELDFWRICRMAGIRKEYYSEVKQYINTIKND